MTALLERGYFILCRGLGRVLRSTRYSRVRLVDQGGHVQVRKVRRFYAPLLIAPGNYLMRMLGTGVRILPQRDWEERERLVHEKLRRASPRVEADGTLVLPALAGETLAAVLEDPRYGEHDKHRAISLAVDALAEFHRLGLTHGDAMGENVMVDLNEGVAHWFDFETLHDPRRSFAVRRADDMRALLASCVLRTVSPKRGERVGYILDRYGDEEVTELVAVSFDSVFRRALGFQLGQAGLSCRSHREIGELLQARIQRSMSGGGRQQEHTSNAPAITP